MKKKWLNTMLVFLFFSLSLHAQEGMEYAFTHYNVNNGLASYITNSCMQDEQGFMWIATANGLQRFDGSRFITFHHDPANPLSIPGNSIGQLLLDRQKNLWISIGGGIVGIFDTKKFIFRKADVKVKDINTLNRGQQLVEDSSGNIMLLFVTAEALTYNKAGNEFSAVYNPFNVPYNWRVTSIIDDPAAEKYWIAADSGLVAYNKQTRNISYRNHNIEHEPMIDVFGNIPYVGAYRIDSKKRFWFLSWPPKGDFSLYCYNLATNEVVLNAHTLGYAVKIYNEPAAMLEQRDGSIWLYGTNIFARFLEDQKIFSPVYNGYVNDLGINYESVNLFEDRERNIWVGTSNNGVYVFNPAVQLFNTIGHINRINRTKGKGGSMAFVRLKNNDLLASFWGDGVYRYDKDFNNKKLDIKGIPEANSLTAWGMCRLHDDKTICMVGQPAFIGFYDEDAGTFRNFQPAIFDERTIRQVAEDKQGNLWLGSHSYGLYKWKNPLLNHFNEGGIYRLENIPHVKVLSIIIDHAGFIWVGTDTEGVYKIDPRTDSIIDHITDKGPPSKKLTGNGAALLEYNDSIMIIGGRGLNIYNTRSGGIVHITSGEGLPSDLVVSVQKDRAGYLWIGMLTGLCRMNLQKTTFSFYDRNDGMGNDNFEVSATCSLPDGRMLFGTSNNFVAFDPAAVKTLPGFNEVAITNFLVLNNAQSVDSLLKLPKVELNATQNSITISFSDFTYLNKNKARFFYMMEGIDKQWKQSDLLNQAVYNYLPPGTYTFKIKSESADAVSSNKITTLKIQVYPPFWKSWWFILLLVLLFSFIFYWIDRLQMKKKEGFQKIRSEIAGNLHEEVNIALNNINILSEMAKIKADNEPAKSKEYIEQIHSKSQNMIIAMDDMLWSLSPENDGMEKTVERMKEYTDALKNRYAVAIELSVDKKVASLELDMKFRYDAFVLFKEGIKSLVLAGTRNCFIHLGMEKNCLIITMQFDNANCNMQELNNLLHRQDLERQMNSIRAVLDVQVHKANSVFLLKLPVLR